MAASLAAQLAVNGFAVTEPVLSRSFCEQLLQLIGATGQPGSRDLLEQAWCVALADQLRQCAQLAPLLTKRPVAVQCTYFEKSKDTNWLVPIHQDLSIPVKARVGHAALTGWSHKQSQLFVQPPVDVLDQLVALRVHLDACGNEDGPLRVVPGSHVRGVVDAQQAPAVRATMGEQICTVACGGVLAMRPLLLHASSKASGQGRRRVLHFVFGPARLPYGLEWALTA